MQITRMWEMCVKARHSAIGGRIFPLYAQFYLDDMKKVSARALFASKYSQPNADTSNSMKFVNNFHLCVFIALSFANDLRER